MISRFIKLLMLLPMLLICLNEAVAIEYNELPSESLEVIRNTQA
jgi:hypothetical protein